MSAGWRCWPRAEDTGLRHICVPAGERLRACDGLRGQAGGTAAGWTQCATTPLPAQIKHFSREPLGAAWPPSCGAGCPACSLGVVGCVGPCPSCQTAAVGGPAASPVLGKKCPNTPSAPAWAVVGLHNARARVRPWLLRPPPLLVRGPGAVAGPGFAVEGCHHLPHRQAEMGLGRAR